MQNEKDVEFTPSAALEGTEREGGIAETAGWEQGGAERGKSGMSDKAQHTAGAVKERADELRDRATDKLESRIEERKHRASDSLEGIAQSLRSARDQMPAENGMARYMGMAADQVEHLANFLDNREVAELFDEVEDFARRQPAAFIGGAFALGVVGGRFLRSSRRELMHERIHEGSGTRELTNRIEEPRDAVSRPGAPGYQPPENRDLSGDGDMSFR